MLESSISHMLFERHSSSHREKMNSAFTPTKHINLEKIIRRPKRAQYFARLTNCETPCDLFVSGDLGQLTSRSNKIENFRVHTQFEVETKKGEFRRLSDMYKWADVDCYQINFQEDIFEESCCGQKVDILSIKKKAQSSDMPIMVFSHASGEDLGSVAHFLMDLVSMLKIEIIAYEYPTFSKNEREAKNKKQKFNEEVLLKYLKEVMIFVEEKAFKEALVRPVFLYGCREGAIPTSLIAIDNQHLVKGIILEDPLIVIETRRGLFWKEDRRYLNLLGQLNQISLLLFHGIQGSQQPFSNSKAIIEVCCSKDEEKKKLVKQKQKVNKEGPYPTYGKSTVFKSVTREGDTIHFETYFVECKNAEIRVLKRAKFYRKINAFIDDVLMSYHSYLRYVSGQFSQTQSPIVVREASPQPSEAGTRFLDKSGFSYLSSFRRAKISNLAVQSSIKLEELKESPTSDTFNLTPENSDAKKIEFSKEYDTTKTDERSQDSSPRRIFDIRPKFKSGIDFTLKKHFSISSSPFMKIKGLHKRKLTFDVADIEGSDGDSDDNFTSRINVLDPRSLKTESNRGSSSGEDTSPFTSPSDGMFEKE